LESIKILNKKFNVKIKLVMCGKNYSNSKNIFNYIYNNKLDDFIVYLGVINFEEKKWLFRNSFATICPALYESSSLVNLEAIASKTSVISSDIPTNIEKSKVFKINIFKKRDSYDFANKVIFLIKNSNLKKEQIKYNYSIIKSWDWHYVSNKYLLVCRNILKDFR
jgi:glycosyltransferase involved in cell wall biosynthesis